MYRRTIQIPSRPHAATRPLDRMSRARMPLLLATGALTVLLAGCTGGAPASPTSPASTTPAASAPSTTSAAPASTPAVDPNAPAGQCPDHALSVSITGGNGGAGSIGYELVFTNTGSAACELRGAPGVSVIDAAGTQLGEAAEQIDDEAPQTLTVQPGGAAIAPLMAVNIDPDGGPLDNCPVVHGTGYRVYPPHSFTGFVVDAENVAACDSDTVFLKVGPVRAG